MKNLKDKLPSKDDANKYLRYSGIAFQMLATILIGLFLGMYLDNKFGTQKIFTAICSLLFVVASLYIVLKEFINK